jgi:hypothetical protein
MSTLTPKIVSQELNIGLATVYDLFKRGKLLGYRIGDTPRPSPPCFDVRLCGERV